MGKKLDKCTNFSFARSSDIALDQFDVSLFDTIKVIISAKSVTDLLVFEQFLSFCVKAKFRTATLSIAYAKIHTISHLILTYGSLMPILIWEFSLLGIYMVFTGPITGEHLVGQRDPSIESKSAEDIDKSRYLT